MTSSVPLLRGRQMRGAPPPREPKPPWLKVRAPGSAGYRRLKQLVQSLNLHTVCAEANCPNIGECWDQGTATFMILGDVCTRSCGYCNVLHGRPQALDPNEPNRVGRAVASLRLDHVVITSVDRDDLPDGGASAFAATVRAIRSARPECRIELLIPDFKGQNRALKTVLAEKPDVLNHNIETVRRLYRSVRPAGRYDLALELLARAAHFTPTIPTKSGLMVGLGETIDEVIETMADLRKHGCRILTVGQYLRPSPANVPLSRYYEPKEFSEIKRVACGLGFHHVESGPLVRSSYHAQEQADAATRAAQ